jgi:hypothetical protein
VTRLNSFLLSISVAAGLASFSCRATFAQSETLTAIPPAQSTATQPLQAAAISGSQPAASNPLAQAPQGPEQRIALVIGNSNYRNVEQLQNPDNDAESMAQFLNSAGFEVIAATDLTQNDMIKVVQDFTAKVAAHGPNTVAMIYYAGHGVQLAGENYLIPVDAKISSPSDLFNNSLRLVDVMATLQSIPSRLRIVLLDACRNNPFANVNDAGRGLAIVDAPNDSIVGYSTAPGAEALDGSGAHSPYTTAFLHLAREPNLPIEQLFKRVRLEVNHATDGKQTPWESSSLISDFYFFGDAAAAATSAPANGPVVKVASNLPARSVHQAYDFVLSEGKPEYYQEFIQMFPGNPLCVRIRWLLANLREAGEWHRTVLLNSPLGYKEFYDRHMNSPYAEAALKLQSQPRLLPLLGQPLHLFPPQHLGLTPTQGVPSGKIVTLATPGNGANPVNNSAGGKIVTLPAQTSVKTLPAQELKTNGPTNRIVDAPDAKHDLHTARRDDHVSKLNTNTGKSNRIAGKLPSYNKPTGRMPGNFNPHINSMGGGGFGHYH